MQLIKAAHYLKYVTPPLAQVVSSSDSQLKEGMHCKYLLIGELCHALQWAEFLKENDKCILLLI